MNEPQSEERIARVVWAAHILSYLANNRSHAELHEPEENEEYDSDTDELEDCATIYDTEKAAILSGTRDSVRQKFLDCIAQLLSPCKGWEGVTATAIHEREDAVEVDIARNDGFPPNECLLDSEVLEYCDMLEKYLAGSAGTGGSNPTAASLTEFESRVIDYTSHRIDHWIQEMGKNRRFYLNCPDWNSERWIEQQAAIKAWTTLTELINRRDASKRPVQSRYLTVKQAFTCLNLTQFREFLLDCFGAQAGLKLWGWIGFIARPLVDCQLLRLIATREPHFRNCRIFLVPSKPKTILDAKYVVRVFEAWGQLGLGSPESVVRKLNPASGMFEKACAASFSPHAEMQLVLHYEEGHAPQPTLDYFGCSKKTCLLCETFLGALPGPIATRGRHGVCYPAWAVPRSSSPSVKIAIDKLEKILVARIRGLVQDLMSPVQKSLAANVMQSDMVSEFSRMTLDEWGKREQDLELFKSKQTAQRTELLITEGVTEITKSKHLPLANFEPEDSCVMCNTSPGRLCARCRSIYYCSSDCQKSDFPSHKLLCKQFATQEDRPSPGHKRAIHFPVEGEKPRMIWIPSQRRYDENGIPWTDICPHPYLGRDNPFPRALRVEHNPVRCRNLGSGFVAFAPFKEGYCVSLQHRDAYLEDGSKTNKSILASVRASGTSTTPHEYRGPMIALRELHHEDYADITLGDFRHLIDYLVSYRNKQVRETVPDLHHRAPTTVRGVRICCYGEVKLHGSEPFVPVDVTRANQIALGGGSISPISVCLGMPIRLWKDPDTEFRHDPPGWEGSMTPDSNPNVAFLMMETDATKDAWGWVPMYWNIDIGNVWAIRTDGKDLGMDDIAKMCHFARRKLQPMFGDVMESDNSLVSRQKVSDFITWDNMVTYWDETGGSRNWLWNESGS